MSTAKDLDDISSDQYWAGVVSQLHEEYTDRIANLFAFLSSECNFSIENGKVTIPLDEWDSWMEKLGSIEPTPYMKIANEALRFYFTINVIDPTVFQKAKRRFKDKITNILADNPEIAKSFGGLKDNAK